MKQRVISSVIMALLGVAIVVFNDPFPLIVNIVVALVSTVAVLELTKALGLEKKLFLCLPTLVAAAAIPFCDERFRFALYAAYTFVLFASMLRYHRETSFNEVAVLYSMTLLVPTALSTLVLLRNMGGMFLFVLALLCAWVADIGAYLAGTFFGKHKLAPVISPKKTIEGAAGGLAVNVLVAMLSGFLYSKLFHGGELQMNYLCLFLAGFFGTFISIIGDLSFSFIKRSCNIKDFGDLIPGHGGILDRFDSVIFTAPFVYLLVSFIPVAA